MSDILYLFVRLSIQDIQSSKGILFGDFVRLSTPGRTDNVQSQTSLNIFKRNTGLCLYFEIFSQKASCLEISGFLGRFLAKFIILSYFQKQLFRKQPVWWVRNGQTCLQTSPVMQRAKLS